MNVKDISIIVGVVVIIGGVIYFNPSSSDENKTDTKSIDTKTIETKTGAKPKSTSGETKTTPTGTGSGTTSSTAPSGVAIGQSVSLGGVKITTTSIIEDSRCPTGSNIRCIWEGKVRALARLRLDSMTPDKPDVVYEFTLGVPQQYDTHMIVLTSALPHPANGKTIRDRDYRFTWEVSPI